MLSIFSDSIYLPKGNWIDYWSGEKMAGGREIKHTYPDNRAGLLFVREGAIIPFQKDMQFIGEKSLDTLIVKVYPKDVTSYTMYEDDGESYEYEKGAIATTRFECKKDNKQIEFIVYPVQGSYKGMYKSRIYELEIETAKCPTQVKINNTPISDWTYGEDKKVRVILPQKDVLSKATCVIL